MARPKNKNELIELANINYKKLFDTIEGLSKEEFDICFDFTANPNLKEKHWKRDKNIRDILIHLYEWHNLLLNWISNNIKEKDYPFLPSPYNWKNYHELNIEFFKIHQKTSYEKSVELLEDSHKSVIDKIKSFTNEELFTKKYYNWTGSTSLASYCISSTSSHYDWAIKKIKKHKKIVDL